MSSIDIYTNRSKPDIRLLTITADHKPRWQHVEELFTKQQGWNGCSVYYDLTGWTPGGDVVVEVNPGSLTRRPPDCVRQKAYWSLEISSGKLVPLGSNYAATTGTREISPAHRPCKEDPDIVGACFAVHGRLSFYNGNPSFRIWHIGTSRVLGVWDDELPIIPDAIWEKFKPHENDVFGDFEVCPFTKKRPEAMQYVCVQSFRNIVIQKP